VVRAIGWISTCSLEHGVVCLAAADTVSAVQPVGIQCLWAVVACVTLRKLECSKQARSALFVAVNMLAWNNDTGPCSVCSTCGNGLALGDDGYGWLGALVLNGQR
jgi:hypothetical protein